MAVVEKVGDVWCIDLTDWEIAALTRTQGNMTNDDEEALGVKDNARILYKLWSALADAIHLDCKKREAWIKRALGTSWRGREDDLGDGE